ncbi:hypothetical protein D8M09_02825 [Enterobacter sp. R1(2018)]|nr:hypothetical protein D8M09_02825 [Enterobacter sp. R1(2018)]
MPLSGVLRKLQIFVSQKQQGFAAFVQDQPRLFNARDKTRQIFNVSAMLFGVGFSFTLLRRHRVITQPYQIEAKLLY